MQALDRVLASLDGNGLLLKQDKELPSVVGLLTGESLRTSWWSHPKGRLIFVVLSELADHPDVLFTKLLRKKDTLVHRRLWPAVLAVGRSRAGWQRDGLSREAARLLERVDGGEPVRASGAPVKELEARLLVTTRQVHTVSGRHEIALESWKEWSRRTRCRPLASVPRAKKALEEAAVKLGAPREALPWYRRKK
jgi:hypothetical protein